MNTFSKVLLVSSLVLGSLNAHVARAGNPAPTERGDVIVRGAARKAVVAGPAELHAYSEFRGGAVYVVPAVSGTDEDCVRTGGGAKADLVDLPADKVVPLHVGVGQIACLATAREGSFELLWHALPVAPDAGPGAATAVASAAKPTLR